MTEAAKGSRDDVALAVYRGTGRMLRRNAFLRLAHAIPRTLRFMADNLERRLAGVEDGLPMPELSLSLVSHVAMDEAILALAMGPSRFPRRADYARVGEELRDARAWLASREKPFDLLAYHRTPPDLVRPVISKARTVVATGSPVLTFEKLSFDSEFEPHPGEIGRERWLGYEANRAAGAWALRHRGADRPWLVCIHGFGMGFPYMDFGGFDARFLHETLGLNLVLPVLPLHGHRKVGRFSGEAFLSLDMMNSLHGLTQSAWDVRRVLSWVRAQTARSVGLYGVSLGAYVASLLAGLDGDLACVVAGIPVCDIPALFRGHAPRNVRLRAARHGILGGTADDVHRLVSPLALPPLVPKSRRFIFAGLGDRVTKPEQAQRLATHWGDPEVLWYPGNHVGYLWSPEVSQFVRSAVLRSLLPDSG